MGNPSLLVSDGERKNRGVGADAEREGKDSDGSEARRLGELAKRKTKVGEHERDFRWGMENKAGGGIARAFSCTEDARAGTGALVSLSA